MESIRSFFSPTFSSPSIFLALSSSSLLDNFSKTQSPFLPYRSLIFPPAPMNFPKSRGQLPSHLAFPPLPPPSFMNFSKSQGWIFLSFSYTNILSHKLGLPFLSPPLTSLSLTISPFLSIEFFQVSRMGPSLTVSAFLSLSHDFFFVTGLTVSPSVSH